MADNRKIIHGVRIGNEVVTDVDKLAKVMTPDMQKRLEEAGSIQGDWAAEGTKEPDKAEPKTKTEKAAKKE